MAAAIQHLVLVSGCVYSTHGGDVRDASLEHTGYPAVGGVCR